MHRSHDYFCVADAYTGSERRIPVCATAKVLLTRMGLHKYEMTISWVYSKRPGRTWKQTICAKPQIHIKDGRVKQPQIDASTSPGDVSKKVVDRGARGRPRKRQPKVLQKRGRPKKAQALLPLNSVQKARRGRPKLMGLKKDLGKRQRRGRPRKMQRYIAKKHTDSKRNWTPTPPCRRVAAIRQIDTCSTFIAKVAYADSAVIGFAYCIEGVVNAIL